jgi:hypothetical protein
MEGLDWSVVGDGLKTALMSAIQFVFSNPVTGSIATAWLAGKGLGLVSGGYQALKGAKGVGGALMGLPAATAAAPLKWGAIGGEALLKMGVLGEKMGSGAKSIGGLAAAGTAGLAGGVVGGITLISAGADYFRAFRSDDREEAIANAQSGAAKAGGVAAGAAAGAILGSVVPVIGTAVGALVGAGIGGVGGWIMGDRIKNRYEESAAQRKIDEHAAWVAREQARYSSQELRDALADTSISAEQFNAMFHRQVMKGLQDRFGEINLSLRDIQGIAQRLTFGDAAESLNRFAAATAEVNASLASLRNDSDKLMKLNWKAELGLEWTDDDEAQFISTAQSFMSQATQYLQDSHFEVDMAFTVIMGEDDSDGIRGGIRDIYAKLQSDIDELTSQAELILGKEGGVLTLDERAEVNKLMGQISDITNQVTQAMNRAELQFLDVKFGGAGMDASSFMRLQAELPAYMERAISGFDDLFIKGLAALDLKKIIDVSFDYDTALNELKNAYLEQINTIELDVFNFQIDAISRVFENETDKILPNLEGDLDERLKTVLTTFMNLNGDLKNLDPVLDRDTWASILGMENEPELAGQIAMLISPVAGMMSRGFLDSFELESDEMANTAYNIFKSDIERAFALPIKWGATIRISTSTMLEYAGDRIAGRAGSLPIGDGEIYGVSVEYPEPRNTITKAQMNNDTTFGRFLNRDLDNSTNNVFGNRLPARAEGGFFNSPEVGLYGEDGPEFIIPVGSKRRQRGLYLWERAGRMLGANQSTPVISEAEGTSEQTERGSGYVNVENITVEVRVDGSGNPADTLDEICHNMAIKLQQVFANMPIEAEGAY